MTPRALEEYKALRATIRQRGATRVWVLVAGLAGWAGMTIATAALAALPVATLLPLLFLAAVFEAVLTIHTGVERIGRYIQVVFEQGDEGWETTAMSFGPPLHGLRTDPIFAWVFIAATVLNFVPALLAEPVPLEVGVVGAVHVIFIARVLYARHASRRQRAVELERFRQMRGEIPAAHRHEGHRGHEDHEEDV